MATRFGPHGETAGAPYEGDVSDDGALALRSAGRPRQPDDR
jgi:hypothetical protein